MAANAETALHQIGALPVRRNSDGLLKVLLVTTRSTRRWSIPKGWPMKGIKDHQAAAQEAREEAGIEGKIQKQSLGSYLYWKRRAEHFDLCRVSVYLLKVDRELERWREKDERDTRWFGADDAAMAVTDPGLSSIISSLKDD
jgi:8-oxo-dGTP pyrophosphatase MutT (NUDIX family)